MRKIYILGAFACLFAACKPSVNITVQPTAGDADFRSYLAIGNSLTAGYADGSLYATGQLNSYPQRLFEQFTQVAAPYGAQGDFKQPLLVTDNGYPAAKLLLSMVYPCVGDSTLSAINLPGYTQDAADAKRVTGQINNIGVPGIRVADYPVSGYGGVNAYAARFYNDVTKTPQDELVYRVNNTHPTFFTMWLGANDVLGYATAGGQGDGSGNAAPAFANFYNRNDITPTAIFDTAYEHAVATAVSTGAKGALINIPDITTIPFFTTIPINGLTISRQSLADSLNAFYGNSIDYKFALGSNYFVVRDHNGNMRQSVPGELILLTTPSDSLTCAGWGSVKPIPQEYVITTEELQNIRNATQRFNDIIKGVAFRRNLAYVDMYSYMSTLQSGITYNGIMYNAQYVSGGAFSLDGVHLTPRGYALVANKIIETINSYYHSTVSPVNVNKYNGVLFP